MDFATLAFFCQKLLLSPLSGRDPPLPGDLFSVGRYENGGQSFHGTIAILRLRLPHANSLALLPNSLDSPALVKLNGTETAVTIMAHPGFFLKKTLLRRDLPAANGSVSNSDSRGIAVRQCARSLPHSVAKQTSNRDRPLGNPDRLHFFDRKQISPPHPKPRGVTAAG